MRTTFTSRGQGTIPNISFYTVMNFGRMLIDDVAVGAHLSNKAAVGRSEDHRQREGLYSGWPLELHLGIQPLRCKIHFYGAP